MNIPLTSPLNDYLVNKKKIDTSIKKVLKSGSYLMGQESKKFEQEPQELLTYLSPRIDDLLQERPYRLPKSSGPHFHAPIACIQKGVRDQLPTIRWRVKRFLRDEESCEGVRIHFVGDD